MEEQEPELSLFHHCGIRPRGFIIYCMGAQHVDKDSAALADLVIPFGANLEVNISANDSGT